MPILRIWQSKRKLKRRNQPNQALAKKSKRKVQEWKFRYSYVQHIVILYFHDSTVIMRLINTTGINV